MIWIFDHQRDHPTLFQYKILDSVTFRYDLAFASFILLPLFLCTFPVRPTLDPLLSQLSFRTSSNFFHRESAHVLNRFSLFLRIRNLIATFVVTAAFLCSLRSVQSSAALSSVLPFGSEWHVMLDFLSRFAVFPYERSCLLYCHFKLSLSRSVPAPSYLTSSLLFRQRLLALSDLSLN